MTGDRLCPASSRAVGAGLAPALLGLSIAEAARVLRVGGLLAFPTETFYGLAVDPLQERALERLFAVKKRDRQKPILLLISRLEQLQEIVEEIPVAYQPLMRRFWPGPLTLVFPARPQLPPLLTADDQTIAVRQTSHPLARRLIDAFGFAITGTSANISGQEPVREISALAADLAAACDLLLDGGATPGGLSSTIVGLRHGIPVVLRQGGVDIFPLT